MGNSFVITLFLVLSAWLNQREKCFDVKKELNLNSNSMCAVCVALLVDFTAVRITDC
jgi:hypothetical protein